MKLNKKTDLKKLKFENQFDREIAKKNRIVFF